MTKIMNCLGGGGMNQKQLDQLPSWPQRQDSLANQLADLYVVANRLGFYDAADAVKQVYNVRDSIQYGCHCDIEDHVVHDSCVIDEGRINDCIFARKDMRKEQCEHWRIKAK